MDESATAREPFARYLVRYLIARRSYKLGVPSQAQELLQHCDYVLTRYQGSIVSTICIVNCETQTGKGFTLPPEDLARIARSVADSLGSRTRLKISICEIDAAVIDRAWKSRLSRYRMRGKGYSVAPIAVDIEAERAWPLPLIGRRFKLSGMIEKLLRSPRLSAAQLSAPEMAIKFGRPVFTFVLMAILVAIFACEQIFALGKAGDLAAPSIETLQAMGGLSYPLVMESGEWWRLFTAPMLHADLTHIGFNCFALFLIGRLLEPLIGWRWTAATFAISALCGSLMSLAVNPINIIGIGASGGIVGLFAAALTVSLRIPAGMMRARLISQAIYGLVPALLPFLNAATSGGKIDYGAHFGGAIGGVTMGFVLLTLWPGRLPRPRWPNLGAFIAILFLVAAAGSLLPIREQYRQLALLAPELPASAPEQDARAAELLRSYPHDPRLLFIRAQGLLRQDNLTAAEADLRAALAEQDLLRGTVGGDLENRLRAVLAAVLREEGKKDEAKSVVAPACASERTGPVADYLKKFSLCL